jgi:hypothetical protein
LHLVKGKIAVLPFEAAVTDKVARLRLAVSDEFLVLHFEHNALR